MSGILGQVLGGLMGGGQQGQSPMVAILEHYLQFVGLGVCHLGSVLSTMMRTMLAVGDLSRHIRNAPGDILPRIS